MFTGNRTLMVAVAVILSAAPMMSAFAEDGLTWTLEPYLWASSVRTNLNVNLPPIDIDTGNTTRFPDLVGKLGGIAEVHGEVQGDSFGALGDVMYLSVNGSRNGQFISTKSQIDATVMELAGVWSPGDSRSSMDSEAIAGVPVFQHDVRLQVQRRRPVNSPGAYPYQRRLDSISMIGGRYTTSLSDRWSLTRSRADGGSGDTDTNLNTSLTANYKTGNGAWRFGYRYMDTKFDPAGRKVGLELYGPTIAYAFVF